MFLTAKAFFEDNTKSNVRLLIRANETIPAEFVRRYKRNVVKLTPYKTGALRRSIITQQIGNTANISWRMPYAKAQNEGGHTVSETRRVYINGRFVTLKPGYYRYKHYTTPGTGAGFAFTAFQQTQKEMPAALRELGLTK